MREIRFGLVAEFYATDETLIANAGYRADANQAQTRHSIECLRKYFVETCNPLTAPQRLGVPTEPSDVTPNMAM